MTRLRQIGCMLGALLVAGGCASTGGAGQGFDGRAKQADEKLPAAARFYGEAERKLVDDAQGHQLAGRKAVDAGDLQRARSEFGAAAERYARFADTFPASEWRIAFRYKAAEFYLFAQQHERAGAQADEVLAEPAAEAVTRAMAAQLSAVAWRGVAVQRIKAGALDPIKLATAEQRGPAAATPRELPEPWKRFVAAVDAYLPVWEKHPEAAKRPADRNLALTPSSAALVAAEVEYSYGRMEEARRRLERLVEAWPADAEAMESAVPLLLQALLALGDERGFSSAADHVKGVLAEQAGKAPDAKAKETLVKVREQVVRLEQGLDFAAAKRALDEGRAAEAAERFERFSTVHAASPDAPSALFNAALAWDKAESPDKAAAAREALVAKFADSKVAPMAALQLASGASRRDDHEGAARHYDAFIARWPDAPNRCLAMQNVGYELDVQAKKAEAAERYLAFGKDERCRKERANEAAKALYRSGKLFTEVKQKPRAREAFESAASVEGVNDPAAKGMIDDAKRQAKR